MMWIPRQIEGLLKKGAEQRPVLVLTLLAEIADAA